MSNLSGDYIWTDNKVEFLKGLPRYNRYYVEGEYERTEDIAPNDDLSFSGFLTYFTNTNSWGIVSDDRAENMFFDEDLNAGEVIQRIRSNRYNSYYHIIHRVHKLSYNVEVSTETV